MKIQEKNKKCTKKRDSRAKFIFVVVVFFAKLNLLLLCRSR